METIHNGTKECPMCAETVKEKAKICRFCRHEFEFSTEEMNNATTVSPELISNTNTKETFYDVWIMSCPTAFQSLVTEALISNCFFETKREALEVVHAIPTKLFVGLTKEEGEHFQKLLVKAGAKVTVQESDMEEHATSVVDKYFDQLDSKEPNAENYYEFISAENSTIEGNKIEDNIKEDLLEEKNIDSGWEVYDNFISTESSPETSKLEVRCDVWIASSYSDKLCNEVIKITKWDPWIAGKFLLDLEESPKPMKLVENLSQVDAENIRKILEDAGATITMEFYS